MEFSEVESPEATTTVSDHREGVRTRFSWEKGNGDRGVGHG